MIIGTFLSDALTNEANMTNNPESARGKTAIEERLRRPFRVNEAVIVQSSSMGVDDAAFKDYVQGLSRRSRRSAATWSELDFLLRIRRPNLVSADRRTTLCRW
jgi:hypothetical protein